MWTGRYTVGPHEYILTRPFEGLSSACRLVSVLKSFNIATRLRRGE
jgi:hypothetical protein